MKKEEQDAINEYKIFIEKENDNKSKFDNYKKLGLKEDKVNSSLETLDNVSILFQKLYNIVTTERSTYIEGIVQKVVKETLEKIPNINKPILENILEFVNAGKDGSPGTPGINGKNGSSGIPGKDGSSIKFLGSFMQHPLKPKLGDCYRNDVHKIVYIFDGKKWRILIKDGIQGGLGSGVGVKEARQIANEEISTNAVKSIFGETGVVTQINSASFDPNYTSTNNPEHSEGLLFYDNEHKTLATYNDQTDTTIHIGQETHVRVCNETGSIIPRGSAVQLTSAIDGIPCVELSIAVIGNTSKYIGLTINDIDVGEIGLIEIHGTIYDINTSAFNSGDVVYLSQTVSGGLQNTLPISPNPVIEVGSIITSHETSGIILVAKDEKPLSTPFEKVLYVSTSGTDSTYVDGTELKPYKTIKYTLDQITDNSSVIRYSILLGPGIYHEINPIQLKTYVSILSIGSPQSTRIVGTTENQALFKGTIHSRLEGFTIANNSTSGITGLLMEEAGHCVLQDIEFFDIKYGVIVDHIDAEILMNNITGLTSTTMDNLIRVYNGHVNLRNLHIHSLATIIEEIFYVSGANSKLNVWNVDSDIENINSICKLETSGSAVFFSSVFKNSVDIGFDIGDGGYLEIISCYLKNLPIAFLVRDGGLLEPFNTICEDCIIDISATSGATIKGTSNFMQSDKLFVDESAIYRMAHMSDTPGDEGFEIKGGLHVGTPEHPSESVFGEGDSYTKDMLLYQGDAISAITDISSLAQNLDTSAFSFSAYEIDQCLYAASNRKNNGDYVIHLGAKILVETSATGGAAVVEYWNGTSWTNTPYMVTDSVSPYYPYSKITSATLLLPGYYQMRYNNNIVEDSWIKNDSNGSGIDRYWLRWRLVVIGSGDAPTFQQLKLHSNRFEINNDGWVEYFGKARPISRLPWDIQIVEKAVTTPADQDLYLGKTVDVGGKRNKLKNVAIDRVGFKTTLPLDCDTSTPIDFQWSVITDDGGGGTIDWTIRWGFNSDGDNVYRTEGAAPTSATHMKEYNASLDAPTAIDTVKWYKTKLDISDMISRRLDGFGDTIWVTIQRDGPSDSAGGDVSLVAMAAYYTKWCEGGHI